MFGRGQSTAGSRAWCTGIAAIEGRPSWARRADAAGRRRAASRCAGSGAGPGVTAVALGVLGTLAGLAVLATSGWLVTRAAEQPPVLALLVGIVTVRALGLVRALARYGERLASHDVALRRLADTRVAFFERLSAADRAARAARRDRPAHALHERRGRAAAPAPARAAARDRRGRRVGRRGHRRGADPAGDRAAARRRSRPRDARRPRGDPRARPPHRARQGPRGVRRAARRGARARPAARGGGPGSAAPRSTSKHASRRLARIDRGQARAAAFGATATTLAAGVTPRRRPPARHQRATSPPSGSARSSCSRSARSRRPRRSRRRRCA